MDMIYYLDISMSPTALAFFLSNKRLCFHMPTSGGDCIYCKLGIGAKLVASLYITQK